MKLTHLFTTAALAVAAATTHAGLINWGVGAQNITGDNDVSTAGTLLGAFAFGNPAATTTVNGVTFIGIIPPAIHTFTSGNFTFIASGLNGYFDAATFTAGTGPIFGLSASYQSLLSGVMKIDFSAPPQGMTLTMNNLVPGATYQFEWWNDQSVFYNNSFTTSAVSVNLFQPSSDPITLVSNRTNTYGGLGQFAVGTFVADATASQTIRFGGVNTIDLLNAFQLRQLTAPVIPEPGTALFGLALAGVTAIRRRR